MAVIRREPREEGREAGREERGKEEVGVLAYHAADPQLSHVQLLFSGISGSWLITHVELLWPVLGGGDVMTTTQIYMPASHSVPHRVYTCTASHSVPVLYLWCHVMLATVCQYCIYGAT